MLRKLSSCCLIALMSLVLSLGPAACTQGLAWFGMLLSYVPEQGLVDGLEQTFDGEHPCSLCCSIAAHREQAADDARTDERQEIKAVADNQCATAAPGPARKRFNNNKVLQALTGYHQRLYRPPVS